MGTARSYKTAAIMLGMQSALSTTSAFFFHRLILKAWALILALILGVVVLEAQSPKPSTAPKKKSRLATAIDETLEKGHDASLPPTISDLLGISPQRKEVPVKQAVLRGEPIRGFEVSTEEHNNVVIFVDNRAQKESIFYLTSRTGVLRRVLAVREGVGHPRRPTKDDQVAFNQEKQRWMDELAPKPAVGAQRKQ